MMYDTLEGENLYHEHEQESKDTTKLEFKTMGGRTVYGGGGVTPDFFVKLDTLTSFTVQLRRLNLFYEYAEKYMTANRKNIESSYSNYSDFSSKFVVTDNMLKNLVELAKERKVELNNEAYTRDLDFIKTSIKSQIARDIWGNEGSYAVFMTNDDQVQKALTLFNEAIKLMSLNK